MTNQNAFMEAVNSVKEIMRVAEEPMTENEILAFFDDMELDDNQKQLVLAYLLNPENVDEISEIEDMDTADNMETDGLEENNLSGTKVFQMYLEELATLPRYTEEEKEELYKKLLQGDTSAIDMILTAWLEKILDVAKEYVEDKRNVEDIVQEGNMALFLKLQELCGSMKKTDVEQELSDAVEKGIMDCISETRDKREMENALVGKVSLVHAARKLLEEEQGRIPTAKELSDYTKMSVKELKDLEDMMK